jgi:hypothetical protein
MYSTAVGLGKFQTCAKQGFQYENKKSKMLFNSNNKQAGYGSK